MNAQDMIKVAAETRRQRFIDGLQDLINATGFRPTASFQPVRDSNFIRPVMIVEPVPNWTGPQGQVGEIGETIEIEGPV